MSEELQIQLSQGELIATFLPRMLKTAKDKRTVSWYKTNLETLEQYWKEFHDRHLRICRSDAIKESEYITADTYGEVQNHYVNVKSQILTAITPGRNQSSPQADAAYAGIVLDPPPHHSPLKPITLPSFSGNRLEWEHFKEMFVALVHDVPGIPPVLKLQYLIGALTGEAAKRLKNLQIKAKNYDGAWKALCRRYDNQRSLITAHMNEVISCAPAEARSVEGITRLMDTMEDARRAFENLGYPIAAWSPWFVHLTVNKLDTELREEWEISLGDSEELPTFDSLVVFLENYVRALDNSRANTNGQTPAAPKPKVTKNTRANAASGGVKVSKKEQRVCPLCQAHHSLVACTKYKSMRVMQRKEYITSNKLCANCLKGNHTADSCRAPGRCYVCQEKHHSSLHEQARTGTDLTSDSIAPQIQPSTQGAGSAHVAAQVHSAIFSQQILLATAVIDLENDLGDTVTLRALLDQGSEFSFITERVAQCLTLNRTEVNIPVYGIGANSPGSVKSVVNVQLKSRIKPSYKIKIEALVLKTLTALIPSNKLQVHSWSHIKGLKLADPNFDTPGKIDCILGADLYCRLLTGKLQRGKDGEPTAQETHLGWILSGPTQGSTTSLSATNAAHSHLTLTDQSLHDSLQAFWKVEEPPSKLPVSPQDEYCENHFVNTYRRDSDGRFILTLPLKESRPEMGDSKSIAVTRWLQTERRLEKDSVLSRLYHNFMKEYWSLRHMEPVEENEQDPGN